jgi:drug/metabolite transporter (DMT)-like permease
VVASLLTALFFAASVVFAARSARVFGGAIANLGRMLIALILLGLWAHLVGEGLNGASLPWFIVSGVVGFGFGDIALFLALTRLGPRLTALVAQCLAAPFGALLEYLWLGTVVHAPQLICGGVILCGVAIAIAPNKEDLLPGEGQGLVTWGSPTPQGHSKVILWTGLLFGTLAALGQAGGAILSRKAYEVAYLHSISIDGGTAAYQRMIGGILTAGIFYSFVYLARKSPVSPPRPQVDRSGGWLWILLHAATGPTLGVACYQWALSSTASGIVLPIVATTPVLTIPFAYLIDKDKPTVRSIIGGLIAVAATIALMKL